MRHIINVITRKTRHYVGLDVSKNFIAVAIADEERDHPRHHEQAYLMIGQEMLEEQQILHNLNYCTSLQELQEKKRPMRNSIFFSQQYSFSIIFKPTNFYTSSF
ncbi:hypothetical protein [Alicyclobacillus tolerans]|uniref:Transposase n=1 Tax=Alicyclobacillus tolerans TaxID=90970 RepID=A0A1M6QMM2_9BACL|nr:hypothetical protein [Alicyclobacillus montanus]SHK21277.1 hypothetical protein SAMN05443507_11047 [Alicyclobacillus montanus]